MLSREGDTVLEVGTSLSPKGSLQAKVSQGPVEILHHRPFAYITKEWVKIEL